MTKVKRKSKGTKIKLIGNQISLDYGRFSTCVKGGAPLLERWRPLEVAAHNQKRWCPPFEFDFC
jgi:hypothetical protein